MALGVPAIKTEHQESSGLESSRETSVPNFAVDEMPPDQFGIPPPDLQVQYQEEMAQALAEGTVGELLLSLNRLGNLHKRCIHF